MKTIFILAGFDLHETTASPEFSQLRKGLADKDYNVVPVDISWLRKSPSQYTGEFIRFYLKYRTDVNIIIGNSFGAVIVLLSAPEINPDTIYLCSLSPFFKEDKDKRSDADSLKYFGKRRLEDLRQYSADEAAKNLNSTNIKTFVLYGEKEHLTSPDLVNRCKDTAAKIKNSTLIEIANAPHDMSDNVYTLAIIDLLAR